MRYSITNWGGENVFQSNTLVAAVNWFDLYAIAGDALWDDESDSDEPLREAF